LRLTRLPRTYAEDPKGPTPPSAERARRCQASSADDVDDRTSRGSKTRFVQRRGFQKVRLVPHHNKAPLAPPAARARSARYFLETYLCQMEIGSALAPDWSNSPRNHHSIAETSLNNFASTPISAGGLPGCHRPRRTHWVRENMVHQLPNAGVADW